MSKRTPDRRSRSLAPKRRLSGESLVAPDLAQGPASPAEKTLDAVVRQPGGPRIEEQRATSGMVPAVTGKIVFAATMPAPPHVSPSAEARRAAALSALVLDEIQSPLLVALAQLDSVSGDPGASDEAKAAARSVQEIVEASRALLLDFVDVTSSEGGGLSPRAERTDVGRLVGDTCMGLTGVARRKTVTLDATSSPRGAVAWLDPRLVRRVVRNLVMHAVQNATPGSVVTVNASTEKGRVEVTVQHHGEVIPSDACAIAFDKFAKLGEPHAMLRRSPGVSLHFCQVAIEAMHGQIRMDAVDVGGARLWFAIPDQ